jgi:hypothetical protein
LAGDKRDCWKTLAVYSPTQILEREPADDVSSFVRSVLACSPEPNLEALLAADNFDRRPAAKVDLAFVRDLARNRYGEMGSRSIDPGVFDGITSERRLTETTNAGRPKEL